MPSQTIKLNFHFGLWGHRPRKHELNINLYLNPWSVSSQTINFIFISVSGDTDRGIFTTKPYPNAHNRHLHELVGPWYDLIYQTTETPRYLLFHQRLSFYFQMGFYR